MKNLGFSMMLIGIITLFLAGCMGETFIPVENIIPDEVGEDIQDVIDDESGSSKGTLKLYLTDAPGDYLAVDILISRIDAHIDKTEEKGEWITLIEWSNGFAVNLIELEDKSILLSTNELEEGIYTQLRVFLMEEASITIEGEEATNIIENLFIPSSAQTGIKLIGPFEIIEGQTTELTLDFDARESVIRTGNGKYIMKPTIEIISENY